MKKKFTSVAVFACFALFLGCAPTMKSRIAHQKSLMLSGQISEEEAVDNVGQILAGGRLPWAMERNPPWLSEFSAYYNMQAARLKQGEITKEELSYLVGKYGNELKARQQARQHELKARKQADCLASFETWLDCGWGRGIGYHLGSEELKWTLMTEYLVELEARRVNQGLPPSPGLQQRIETRRLEARRREREERAEREREREHREVMDELRRQRMQQLQRRLWD